MHARVIALAGTLHCGSALIGPCPHEGRACIQRFLRCLIIQRQRYADWARGWCGLRQRMFHAAEFGFVNTQACLHADNHLINNVSPTNIFGIFPNTTEVKSYNEHDEERRERAGRGCSVGLVR